MPTFTLVHGAWTGAFGFRHVRRLLQAQGHDVFTPSLTGVGDRAHLASPLVDLRMHVRDVVNLVLYEDLRDIVLLGFSYGGFVVSGGAGARVARVEVPRDRDEPHGGEQSAAGADGDFAGAGEAGLRELGCVHPSLRRWTQRRARNNASWYRTRRSPCWVAPASLR